MAVLWFKVFVGTRIAEIQDLTDSENNPTDDITCGKHLQALSATSRWFQGPDFSIIASIAESGVGSHRTLEWQIFPQPGHLDLLLSLDTDSILMALRRFVSRCGKPFELLSDQGTNFKGGDWGLQDTFASLQPDLKAQLASQQIMFTFNPRSAPHFGGCWEREIRKQALQVTIGTQSITAEVLQTVLVEIEGFFYSRLLGYISLQMRRIWILSHPNILLMGWLNASLPQVVYPESELLSKGRWRFLEELHPILLAGSPDTTQMVF